MPVRRSLATSVVAGAAAWPPEDRLEEAAMGAARCAFTYDQPAGADTAMLPNVPWLFVPLRTARGRLGVVGVARTKTFCRLDPEARTLLEAIADQAAAALDRAALAREISATRTAAADE